MKLEVASLVYWYGLKACIFDNSVNMLLYTMHKYLLAITLPAKTLDFNISFLYIIQ